MSTQNSSRPSGILPAVLVSVPALALFPLRWLREVTRPPDPLWYFADRFVWIFLLAPISLVLLLVMWPRFSPQTTVQYVILILLLLLNVYVVFSSLGLLAQVAGL